MVKTVIFRKINAFSSREEGKSTKSCISNQNLIRLNYCNYSCTHQFIHTYFSNILLLFYLEKLTIIIITLYIISFKLTKLLIEST